MIAKTKGGKNIMINGEKLLCPNCGRGCIARIRKDTAARNLPLYCGRCKQESIVDILK